MFSEMVTDLSNKIVLAINWDSTTLRCPAQPVTPTPTLLDESISIALDEPLPVQ